MVEPKWIAEARKHIGITEVKGIKHNPKILEYWKLIKRGGIKDDETPWCAGFAGAVLELVGIVSSRFESAKSYLTWGVGLNKPIYGCIAVLTRQGGGHVGFVVGKTSTGDILILGGNQGDSVSIRAFPPDRITAYRWPAGVPTHSEPLQIGSAPMTSGEA